MGKVSQALLAVASNQQRKLSTHEFVVNVAYFMAVCLLGKNLSPYLAGCGSMGWGAAVGGPQHCELMRLWWAADYCQFDGCGVYLRGMSSP